GAPLRYHDGRRRRWSRALHQPQHRPAGYRLHAPRHRRRPHRRRERALHDSGAMIHRSSAVRAAALPLLVGIAVSCNIDRLLRTPPAVGTSPARLVFTSQPDRVVTGDPIGVRVAVQDSASRPVPDYTGPVTVALDSNPGRAALGGTTQVNAANGVATFSDL